LIPPTPPPKTTPTPLLQTTGVQDGKPDGLGVLSLQTGTTYDAQWRGGKRHGVCVHSTATEAQRCGSRR